ncbi:toxic anion resistance protein [Iodobacter sp. LRB]|uniref:toxic anion resistance protein n=1 Tax=unclassified Iodobacter TaxID=235634 RepID=UPI000C0C69DD|nr:toxic anion resistance protein [Iodobacter sp. BJB302]PHV01691.1 toxic anion resistance protein [Iodobacter sp. BJB302]
MSDTLQPPEALVLTPPEAVIAVPAERAPEMAPLSSELKNKVEEQVSRFVSALVAEDVSSDSFKQKLDAAFHLGREEISQAAGLMTGRFMDRNLAGVEDSAAFKAIGALRGQLDELNPGKQGDLLSENKILGLIPFGNKLKAYFRKFQSAGTQLNTALQQVHAARDDMLKDAAEIETIKQKLWDAMQKLGAAIHFARELDQRLAGEVERLKTSDAERARALEQEVLFYARQNVSDMQTQMAVTVNGYMAMEVLKKTGREMANGCSRVATTGMSALAVATTVARATGNQIEVMNMLQGVSGTIGDLIEQSGKALNTHVQKTGEFASSPLIGIERIQSMFDQSFAAMDAMDKFRSEAIGVMGKNNELIRQQIERAQTYVDRAQGESVRQSLSSSTSDGPVKL